MAELVHGVDCNKIGKAYAETLLKKASTSLDDFPALQTLKNYKKLCATYKKEVCSNVQTAAKAVLLKNGYPPAKVEQIVTTANQKRKVS